MLGGCEGECGDVVLWCCGVCFLGLNRWIVSSSKYTVLSHFHFHLNFSRSCVLAKSPLSAVFFIVLKD